jgi:hypothetical protein
MFGFNFGTVLVIFMGTLFLSLAFVNYFYQKRADDFADNLLADNPIEYNKQIKGNAFRYLAKSIIWSFFTILLFVLYLHQSGNIFSPQAAFSLFSGCGFVVWGILSCKKELKKLKSLK